MSNKVQPPGKHVDQLGFRPKRFWTTADVTKGDDGFAVVLDGRPVKTPQVRWLALPTAGLAEAVAAEWRAVGDHVDYESMPLTRLGFAAVDRMGELVDETVVEALRYAETDLVCYPADYPEALIERERAAWLPVLGWARGDLGLSFEQNLTLVHRPQPAETLAGLEGLVRGMTAYERAGLMSGVALFGSVVLALALWRGHLTGVEAFAASKIGEDFQAETWGKDAEAAQRRGIMQGQAVSLQTWFEGLKG